MDYAALSLSSVGPNNRTVVRVLSRAFEEIRWNHPGVRVSCGAFTSPTSLRFVASAQPSTMVPLHGLCVVGDAVERFRDLLERTDDVLVAADLRSDPRFVGIPATIVGDDTRATMLLPLLDDGVVLGFVRLDGRDDGFMSPRALGSLHAAADAALLAASLEPELALARREARDLSLAKRWLTEHVQRQDDALARIKDAVTDAANKLESMGRTSDPATHRAVRELCEEVRGVVDSVHAALNIHAAEAGEATVRLRS